MKTTGYKVPVTADTHVEHPRGDSDRSGSISRYSGAHSARTVQLIREALEIDLACTLERVDPAAAPALGRIVSNRELLSTAAEFLLDEYGEDVHWTVIAWGTIRFIVRPYGGVSRHGDEIVKIGMVIPDPPQHELILQARATRIHGKDEGGRTLGVECYPFADILGATDLSPYPEIRAGIDHMRVVLKEAGFDISEVHPSNIGCIGEGRLTLVDNEVYDLHATRYPVFGTQEKEESALRSLQLLARRRSRIYQETRLGLKQLEGLRLMVAGLQEASVRQLLAELERRQAAVWAEYNELMRMPEVYSRVFDEAVAADIFFNRRRRERDVSGWLSRVDCAIQQIELKVRNTLSGLLAHSGRKISNLEQDLEAACICLEVDLLELVNSTMYEARAIVAKHSHSTAVRSLIEARLHEFTQAIGERVSLPNGIQIVHSRERWDGRCRRLKESLLAAAILRD
jgi:hypothetical protein